MGQVHEKMSAQQEQTKFLSVSGKEEHRRSEAVAPGVPALEAAAPAEVEGAEPLADALIEIFQLIHRVNNHLQVITINAEMLEMMTGRSNRYVEKILEGAGLIRDMMDGFRDNHADQRQRLLGLRRQIKVDLALG